VEEVIKKFRHFNVDPIFVDEQLKDGDMIGSLQVIHTPGHTPGHISLYSEKHKTMFGADSLFKSVLGMDGLFIPPESSN
jgi:glyoxylase-like metal-dependent hydrolase (beta-lactamase superfamily II)